MRVGASGVCNKSQRGREPLERTVALRCWQLGSIDWAASLNSAADPWSALQPCESRESSHSVLSTHSEATPGVFVDDYDDG